jgi:hypothetical protein
MHLHLVLVMLMLALLMLPLLMFANHLNISMLLMVSMHLMLTLLMLHLHLLLVPTEMVVRWGTLLRMRRRDRLSMRGLLRRVLALLGMRNLLSVVRQLTVVGISRLVLLRVNLATL